METDHHGRPSVPPVKERGIREILLAGVFWRILIIEAILLVGSVIYRMITEDAGFTQMMWYAMRIVLLVVIIILFMMITLRRFLEKRIIRPLEAIADANARLDETNLVANSVRLDDDAAVEIRQIVNTRSKMLESLLKVSDQRLQLVNFIKETFGRYLSHQIVAEILASPSGGKIGGRRQTVTVLMSDLRGFSDLSDAQDPEVTVQLLNRYLEAMTQVIHDYDGVIDEFIGDAILTVFGIPEAKPDDPARAVACALAMQRALADLNPELEREGMPPLEMGIGINTGPVIVGNLGSEARTKYGLVGSVVNIAARIESNTLGGQVLLGDPTFQQVRELVVAQPPLAVMMKGLKKPLVCYPVTAMGPPYDVSFSIERTDRPVEIRLPFQLWRMDGKKILSEIIDGETRFISDAHFAIDLPVRLEPLTNVKLLFSFCREAHCFSDIYAKILGVDQNGGRLLHRLGVTYMDPHDKALLSGWIATAAAADTPAAGPAEGDAD